MGGMLAKLRQHFGITRFGIPRYLFENRFAETFEGNFVLAIECATRPRNDADVAERNQSSPQGALRISLRHQKLVKLHILSEILAVILPVFIQSNVHILCFRRNNAPKH
jgi:hypothetical protein